MAELEGIRMNTKKQGEREKKTFVMRRPGEGDANGLMPGLLKAVPTCVRDLLRCSVGGRGEGEEAEERVGVGGGGKHGAVESDEW